MVKKIFIGLLIIGLLGLGSWKLFCSSKSNRDELVKKVVKELDSYYMEAVMEMLNGEEQRNFNVAVSYLKSDGEDKFRISLLDNNINQQQILLRNGEGVYVLTPTLNQVYKFSSDWPLNSPKPYLFHSIVDVIKKDGSIKSVSDGYLISAPAEYKNSPSWKKQEIKINKDLHPVYVHILNDLNQIVVNVTFTKVDLNPDFDEKEFVVDDNMVKGREEMTSTVTSTITDLPLLPAGADVSSTLKESTKTVVNGKTTYILTYQGDTNFTITQKMASIDDFYSILEVEGEVVDLFNGFGWYNNGVLSYTYNGVEYNIYAKNVATSLLVEVANGMQVVSKK
ncbi:MAG: hypothetical protein E7184_02845 [Erysipelotrichaceae bacterium]|nr:hypothetical protein [Erysipelotrichaceae bacterium]